MDLLWYTSGRDSGADRPRTWYSSQVASLVSQLISHTLPLTLSLSRFLGIRNGREVLLSA